MPAIKEPQMEFDTVQFEEHKSTNGSSTINTVPSKISIHEFQFLFSDTPIYFQVCYTHPLYNMGHYSTNRTAKQSITLNAYEGYATKRLVFCLDRQ